ncbi:MAG: hypothetical protein H6603_11685 [Flavobacteriales bacterium]|nr:hypothetical protein [Flavobacteriales bacterium]MCB9190215.1 hypothetical protein [Flavobacteriales bacterium]MCB9205631.1 hypothetical protein [Flavobacteriales bacterium]
MKRLLVFGFLLVLSACGSKESAITDVLGDGHFRSNKVGDAREKVEKTATADNIIERSDESINCELTVDDIEMVVRYDFDQTLLYSIQADLFFPDSATLSSFQEKLVEHYNTKYGTVDLESGFLVWQESGKVEFTLADESIEFGQPKLSLTIYNFDY